MKEIYISAIVIILIILSGFLPASQLFGKTITKVNTDEKQLILTFDDGPGENTNEILDILKEENVKAIFFVVGNQIDKYPDTLKRIVDEGHEIGVHGQTHKINLFDKNEILQTKLKIENITGQKVKYYRPAYGIKTPYTIKVAKKNNMQTIMWSIFPRDYKSTKDEIVKRVTNKFFSGAIICLHDGPENREETVKALPEIIKKAKEENYEFASI